MNSNIKKLLFLTFLLPLFIVQQASAHRDGCHRWHSCPSDTGSYVCGDLGYTSECPGGAPVQQVETQSVAPTEATQYYPAPTNTPYPTKAWPTWTPIPTRKPIPTRTPTPTITMTPAPITPTPTMKPKSMKKTVMPTPSSVRNWWDWIFGR